MKYSDCACLALTATLLAGCQTAPAPQLNSSKTNATATAKIYDQSRADSVCKGHEDSDPALNKLAPLRRARPIYPTKAIEAGVIGCAVVLLTIDQAGLPHDATLVAEYPAGWGFGQSAIQAAENTVFVSGHSGWKRYFYINFRLAPSPPAPLPKNRR